MKKFLLTLAVAVMLVMPAAAENWVYVGKSYLCDNYLDTDSIIASSKNSRDAWLKEINPASGCVLYRYCRFASSAVKPGSYAICEYRTYDASGNLISSLSRNKFQRIYSTIDLNEDEAFYNAYYRVWDANVEWDGKTLLP